jgi:uncharacterized SAM-binding protein YcdF (DUF218 family)
MFILKKAIAPFILPPGIFILPILFVGMVLMFSRRRRLGWINLAVGLMLWALSTVPVATWLMRGLEAGFPIPENPSGDVIILLGGGITERVPDISGEARPAYSTLARIVTAVRLSKTLPVPIIVTGGRVHADNEIAEATVIKRFLTDLGVPANRIIEEDRARDTSENARLAAIICRQKGFSRPILLTAAYHLKRAMLAFEVAGMQPMPFPAYFIAAGGAPFSWRHLLPSANALRNTTKALHEHLGYVYYWMKGI